MWGRTPPRCPADDGHLKALDRKLVYLTRRFGADPEIAAYVGQCHPVKSGEDDEAFARFECVEGLFESGPALDVVLPVLRPSEPFVVQARQPLHARIMTRP